jgi:hypothetical protein
MWLREMYWPLIWSRKVWGKRVLDVTVVHRLPRFQGLTMNTWSHSVVLADWQGRNEVTWRPSHLLVWHHLFSCQQCTLNHGNECLKKLPWVTCVSWCSLSIGAAERYFI